MTEIDEAEAAAARLEAALARIAGRQAQLAEAARNPATSPIALKKLDTLIRAVRDALEA